jgi:hypothetical protein
MNRIDTFHIIMVCILCKSMLVRWFGNDDNRTLATFETLFFERTGEKDPLQEAPTLCTVQVMSSSVRSFSSKSITALSSV